MSQTPSYSSSDLNDIFFGFVVLNCFLWHSHRSGDILVTVSGYNSRYFWICL